MYLTGPNNAIDKSDEIVRKIMPKKNEIKFRKTSIFRC